MSPAAATPATHKPARPIVPFLRLGDPGDQPHLVAKKCANCGAVYLSTRVACSKCFATGPFDEIRLSNRGEPTAFREAYFAVGSGEYDVAMAVGSEQMGKSGLLGGGGNRESVEGILGSGLMPGDPSAPVARSAQQPGG